MINLKNFDKRNFSLCKPHIRKDDPRATYLSHIALCAREHYNFPFKMNNLALPVHRLVSKFLSLSALKHHREDHSGKRNSIDLLNMTFFCWWVGALGAMFRSCQMLCGSILSTVLWLNPCSKCFEKSQMLLPLNFWGGMDAQIIHSLYYSWVGKSVSISSLKSELFEMGSGRQSVRQTVINVC